MLDEMEIGQEVNSEGMTNFPCAFCAAKYGQSCERPSCFTATPTTLATAADETDGYIPSSPSNLDTSTPQIQKSMLRLSKGTFPPISTR